jgi:hypothetical protein
VNQLVDTSAQDLVDLVEVSDRLASLLGDSIDADAAVELREAVRERQQLLQDLADRADAAMRAAGHPGHRDEMLATIDAATMDDARRAELLDGRLAKVLPSPARFGPVGLSESDPAARARSREPALAPVTELRRRDDDSRVRKEQEQGAARAAQRIERAREGVTRRSADAGAATTARAAADDARASAEQHVAELEADLARARDDLRRAQQAADRARAGEQQALAKLADAERALEQAGGAPER